MPTATDREEPALGLTGERTLPGIWHENYWFRRHEAAYLALQPLVTGAVVLEAGCGEGYGADLLAAAARRVVALDYDDATARHVRRTYPHVAVVRGDLQHLPVADGAVAVVANLQVIEHLWDQPGFVAECARVLQPGGTLLVTTPNRLTFSPGRGPDERPLNPFHTRELTGAELAGLVAPWFEVTRLEGIGHGPRLREWEAAHGTLVDALLAGPPESWSPGLRGLVAGITAADFAVGAAADVDTSLDLLLVARRRAGGPSRP